MMIIQKGVRGQNFLGLIKNRNFRIFVFVILVSGVSKRFILNESSSSLENYGLIEEKVQNK